MALSQVSQVAKVRMKAGYDTGRATKDLKRRSSSSEASEMMRKMRARQSSGNCLAVSASLMTSALAAKPRCQPRPLERIVGKRRTKKPAAVKPAPTEARMGRPPKLPAQRRNSNVHVSGEYCGR